MFSKFFTGALFVSVALPASSVQFHPNHHNNICLDVRGNIHADGTPVQIYDCNGTGAQNWVLNPNSTKVQLANTNFCLDAGFNPPNFSKVTIQTCTPNFQRGQDWVYIDPLLAVTGTGQCLDLPNGNLKSGTQVQTYQCDFPNPNQIWNKS